MEARIGDTPYRDARWGVFCSRVETAPHRQGAVGVRKVAPPSRADPSATAGTSGLEARSLQAEADSRSLRGKTMGWLIGERRSAGQLWGVWMGAAGCAAVMLAAAPQATAHHEPKPPRIVKTCTPECRSADRPSTAFVPEDCVIEDELYRGIEYPTDPLEDLQRGEGESLGSKAVAAGAGQVSFELPSGFSGAACNVGAPRVR